MTTSAPGDPRPWKILDSAYLHRKPWLTLRKDTVRLANGRVIDDYYVQEFPAWVNVVAVTEARELVLIRQYRHGIGKVFYELPAGVHDGGHESFLEAAQRELMEETGYVGGTWRPWMQLSANPALQDNISHTFLAEGVRADRLQALDPTEEITVTPVPLDRLEELVLGGGMIQALHVAPILKYLMKSNGR